MSILWDGDQHQETTCSHLRRTTRFHPFFSVHILRWYSAFPLALFLINQTAAAKETKNLFFLFPRGFEASSEGCHCSAVFNVNHNAQTWVTPSLSCLLSASTKARCENRDALQNYKLYSYTLSIFKRNVINPPLWENLHIWWGFIC